MNEIWESKLLRAICFIKNVNFNCPSSQTRIQFLLLLFENREPRIFGYCYGFSINIPPAGLKCGDCSPKIHEPQEHQKHNLQNVPLRVKSNLRSILIAGAALAALLISWEVLLLWHLLAKKSYWCDDLLPTGVRVSPLGHGLEINAQPRPWTKS